MLDFESNKIIAKFNDNGIRFGKLDYLFFNGFKSRGMLNGSNGMWKLHNCKFTSFFNLSHNNSN